MSRAAPWLVIASLVLVYPALSVATGAPGFPSRDDCIHPAEADGQLDAVFGYFDSELEAARLRDRALELGFEGTEMQVNGCGRVRVAVGGIPTLAVGKEFQEQARTVGLDVTLEQASGQ